MHRKAVQPVAMVQFFFSSTAPDPAIPAKAGMADI
jgi:hypothetical protein